MADLEQLNKQKERILSTIRARGPSLPVQIAKSLEVSPLFASAFLSELRAEDKLRLSNMKVGSSPLYFVPGQENLLENFIQYLNQREREAFDVLKREQTLEDEKQSPVVRVALRAIKDFAIPVRVRIDGEAKLFWKYFGVSDAKLSEIISQKISGKPKVEEEREAPTERTEEISDKVGEKPKEKKVEGESATPKEEKNENEKKSAKKKESRFGNLVRDYLSGKDVEILEIFSEKKREVEGRVRVDGLFGKQEFYLIAKDKKSATDNDMAVAWQKAQVKRLPALVMSTGGLNKKAKEHLQDWGNLVKFEKLNF